VRLASERHIPYESNRIRSPPPAMAVAGLLLRPPPCVAMCTPSPSPFPSSQRRRRRRLTLAQPYCTLGLSFVSGRHHRFLLRRRRRTGTLPQPTDDSLIDLIVWIHLVVVSNYLLVVLLILCITIRQKYSSYLGWK
jgi:hypothetical protein